MDRHASRPLLLIAALALTGCAGLRLAGSNFSTFVRPTDPAPVHVEHPVRADARLAVLWIGHATALVQLDDAEVLTDPIFTATAGQLSKRLVAPGLAPEELPPIDVALISHMHFDHLSQGSLDMIEPKVARLFVPLGALAYVPDHAFPIDELETWESVDAGRGLRVTAVPAKHHGFRYGVDAAWMDTSFTGWVIEKDGLTVYFAGDTGYDQARFRAIRARFPHIDLALLPIGPIEPREIMQPRHLDPDEALRAFDDVGARVMVPIHFGTFQQGTDAIDVAPRELDRLVAEKHLEARVWRLVQGEQRVVVAR